MAFQKSSNSTEPLNMQEYIRSLLDTDEQKEKVPSNAKLAIIRNRFCSKCNAEEFATYVIFCILYDLDPLRGLVECIKYSDNSPAQIFLGKDALLVMAYRNKDYKGFKWGIYYSNPNLIVARNLQGDADSEPTMSIMRPNNKEKPPELHAWCIVYRKGKEPIKVDIKASEYHKYNDIWSTKTETMCKKVALSQALGLAFPDDLAGVYVKEEFELEDISVLDKTDPMDTVENIMSKNVPIYPFGLDNMPNNPKFIKPEDYNSSSSTNGIDVFEKSSEELIVESTNDTVNNALNTVHDSEENSDKKVSKSLF